MSCPGADGLRAFRRNLHAHPELSGREAETARRVVERLAQSGAARIVTGLGAMQTGVCAVYAGRQAGPTVLVRCELDALPIQERNIFAHRSTVPGVAHQCGHDGHMATLVALADDLAANPIARGRAFLLFQPAEESGAGALAVLGRYLLRHPVGQFGRHHGLADCGYADSFWEAINQITLPRVLLNLLIAIPFYALFSDLAKWLYAEPLEI